MTAALRLVVAALITLPLMPLQQLFVWTWPAAARRFPHIFHRLIARVLGMRITVAGKPAQGLMASNHVSWLDIIVLSAVAPVSFIAKREVNGWPFFGSLARLQRTVFIDRDKRSTSAGSAEEMRERLKSGDTLVLFAEGTTSDGARVKPFKSAYFAAAKIPGLSVQPVSLVYRGQWGLPMNRRWLPSYAWYGEMDLAPHLWGALKAGPLEVTVILHEPTSLEANGDRKVLARQVEQKVRHGLILSRLGRES
jgi:1-acyl-sn-glycerol-3-phosphate acyltransferase